MTKFQNSKFITTNYQLPTTNFNEGFTLVELIITIGIISLVSAFLLANYPDFSERIALERASRIVGLAIRDAQIRAMSIREFKGIFPAYGVHFGTFAADDEFILFADNDCEADGTDCIYTDGNPKDFIIGEDRDGDGKPDPIKITSGVKIADLCANLKSATPDDCTLSAIDVVFKRPDPFIFLNGNSGVCGSDPNDVEIILESQAGKRKTVGVWCSGQVFVE